MLVLEYLLDGALCAFVVAVMQEVVWLQVALVSRLVAHVQILSSDLDVGVLLVRERDPAEVVTRRQLVNLRRLTNQIDLLRTHTKQLSMLLHETHIFNLRVLLVKAFFFLRVLFAASLARLFADVQLLRERRLVPLLLDLARILLGLLGVVLAVLLNADSVFSVVVRAH